MGFTQKQIRWIQTVRRKIDSLRVDEHWRLVLRYCGIHVDPRRGVPSLTHPKNSQPSFEALMHQLAGYPASGLDPDEWGDKVAASERRLARAIETYAYQCVACRLLKPDALPAFIERMTKDTPEAEGVGVRSLDNCGLAELMKIAEGLKAWMNRQAKSHGIKPPKFADHSNNRRAG